MSDMKQFYVDGMTMADIAKKFGVELEYVEGICDTEGWDSYIYMDQLNEMDEYAQKLPFPLPLAELITQLEWLKRGQQLLVDVMPTPEIMTFLNELETSLLKITKKRVSTDGRFPMSLAEARDNKVEWLAEFEAYLGKNNYVDAEILDD